MKTAEDWINQDEEWDYNMIEQIKQIQLDAYKAGMSEAANIAMTGQRSETSVAQDILAARDNKTSI